MIKRVFVDTDVILDIALARQPFLTASKAVLAMIENGLAIGVISSNCIANIYYILRKQGGDDNARIFLSKLLEYLAVIPIDHSNVLEALKSDFGDFEDALQNYAAIRNQCDCIVTRNIDDYKKSKLDIYQPSEFLYLYQ